MLQRRCSQPPCMNTDVSGAYHTVSPPITHAVPLPIGMAKPSGSRWRNSPGMSPRRQTDADRLGSAPMPWTRIQAATLAAMSANVATGAASVGLSSR
jgi:hypothetical protein